MTKKYPGNKLLKEQDTCSNEHRVCPMPL